MKNLSVFPVEKLEELPKTYFRNVGKDFHSRKHKWKDGFPWKRVHNFIKSNVGNYINDVYSKYCKLEWLPKEFKNREWFSKKVFLISKLENGKIFLQNDFGGDFFHIDTTYYTELYYVHPETKKLEYYRKSVVNYKKMRQLEIEKICKILGDYHQLVKLDGIWHEVKAEPDIPSIIKLDGFNWILYGPAKYKIRECDHVKGIEKELDAPDYIKKNCRVVDGYIYTPCKDRYWIYSSYIKPRTPMVGVDQKLNTSGVKLTFCKQIGSKMLKKYGLKNDIKTLWVKKCDICGDKRCFYHKCSKCRLYFNVCKC